MFVAVVVVAETLAEVQVLSTPLRVVKAEDAPALRAARALAMAVFLVCREEALVVLRVAAAACG